MGRTRQWSEDMQARFPSGTFARMSNTLEPQESKTDLVRLAVERELNRREGNLSGQAPSQRNEMKVKRGRGRPRINAEGQQMTARFPNGTLQSMKDVLREGEPLASMMREAVENEIRRRNGTL